MALFVPLAEVGKSKQNSAVNEFLQRLEAAVRRRRLLVDGEKVLVAVSGGVDSMVLLHALNLLAPEHRWKISVAHFNHRLRGRASDADEALVRKTALELGLPLTIGAGDVKGVAARSKISTEMAARKLRHEFLARTAQKLHIRTVVLAHHADDQVELFFLRLLRGSGSEGMAGMKWLSSSPADKAIAIIRPLLDFSKADLEDVARKQRIKYRKDASNSSNDFLRNRVRNELLPLLRKKYQPGIDKTLLRLMEIAGGESEFVSDVAQGIADGGRTANVLPRNAAFDKLPLAIQRRLLQQRLIGLGLVPEFELIELLRREPGKRISVGVGLAVLRDTKGIIRCQEQTPADFKEERQSVDLAGKRTGWFFAGRQFQWQVKESIGFQLSRKVAGKEQQDGCEYFDAEKIGSKVILRHWQPGDRFQPIGLNSPAKLQDLFVNAKIPATRRREIVVATTSAGEIFWVEGLRIGERFKLTSQTRRRLVWHYKISA